jgi:excisionase family DNA binding protein
MLDESAEKRMPRHGHESANHHHDMRESMSRSACPSCGDVSPGGREVDDLLTTRELALWLKVPLSRVYSWTSDGQIPHYKLGHRTLRFSRVEVLRWLRQTVKAPKESANDGTQKRRSLVRGLQIPRPDHGNVEAIQAFDWTGHDQEGGP